MELMHPEKDFSSGNSASPAIIPVPCGHETV